MSLDWLPLIQTLSEGTPEARDDAAQELVSRGDQAASAMPLVYDLMVRSEENRKYELINVLSALPIPAAAETLVIVARSNETVSVRAYALRRFPIRWNTVPLIDQLWPLLPQNTLGAEILRRLPEAEEAVWWRLPELDHIAEQLIHPLAPEAQQAAFNIRSGVFSQLTTSLLRPRHRSKYEEALRFIAGISSCDRQKFVDYLQEDSGGFSNFSLGAAHPMLLSFALSAVQANQSGIRLAAKKYLSEKAP